jgi:hypothetical protein
MYSTPKITLYQNEVACELAELFIQMKYDGQNVQLYDINEDDDSVYSDWVQREYNETVEKIEELLISSRIK